MQVIKRDGSYQEFDSDKIAQAIMKCGIESTLASFLSTVVVNELAKKDIANPHIETIQDLVEKTLMTHGCVEEAKAYILYRQERAKAREVRKVPDINAISDYTHISKYSRFSPELGRRELWEESVARLEAMHIAKFPALEADTRKAFDLVRKKVVLPSMRSLQFGGKAIELNNARLYNCSFSLADRPMFFSETFYLLLSGCGVGYSVQFQHVEKLPKIRTPVKTAVWFYKIEDSLEGWAKALEKLMLCYMSYADYHSAQYIDFDYSAIRPQGQPLKTSGGKAPGHVPLKLMLEKVRLILENANGRKLKPIEVHDITCHIADAVLAGGIRRSSLIALFSSDDSEMMECKTADKWWINHPQRALANNSAVLIRGDYEKNRRAFDRIFEKVKAYGEPGFFFTANPDFGCNPCGEIGLNPVDPKTGKTGFSFCNLCEINASAIKTEEELYEAARAAAYIGTLQASYTNFPYIGGVTKDIAEREALLGVSMTGVMDNPIALDQKVQWKAAAIAVAENRRAAKLMGINPAARVTTVKPSGTASLLLGCVGSGIHPHHARRYIRRVRANPLEPTFIYFKQVNPHMCLPCKDGKGDWLIEFPVQCPDNAIVRDDLSAKDFMTKVFDTYTNWVIPGTADIMSSPGLTHNVSCTVTVKENEWDAVKEYAWSQQNRIAAMSFLAYSGDKDYVQAPREAIVTPADEVRWNELVNNYKPIDWSKMVEEEDTTAPSNVGACDGPACEVRLNV